MLGAPSLSRQGEACPVPLLQADLLQMIRLEETQLVVVDDRRAMAARASEAWFRQLVTESLVPMFV